MDLNINRMIPRAIRSKSKLRKRFTYWFCKHYFYCDIHPNKNISETVQYAHNGLGVVINEDAIIEDHVTIQHHVTIGRAGDGVPHIKCGAYIGAHAIVIGDIEVGAHAIVGAGCVVTKNVPDHCTVVGNPMRILTQERS